MLYDTVRSSNIFYNTQYRNNTSKFSLKYFHQETEKSVKNKKQNKSFVEKDNQYYKVCPTKQFQWVLTYLHINYRNITAHRVWIFHQQLVQTRPWLSFIHSVVRTLCYSPERVYLCNIINLFCMNESKEKDPNLKTINTAEKDPLFQSCMNNLVCREASL